MTVTIETAVFGVQGTAVRRIHEPITLGIPFPQGLCRTPNVLTLLDPSGIPVPLQAAILNTWADGSARWMLLDFQVDMLDELARSYQLRVEESPRHVGLSAGVNVREERGGVTVDTGPGLFHVRVGGRFPFEQVLVNGRPAVDIEGTRLAILDARERECEVSVERVDVEEPGALRTVLVVRGTAISPGRGPLVEFIARLHFFAGLAIVKFALTVRNPRRARHRGGYWELGDSGSVYLRDVSAIFTLPANDAVPRVQLSVEPGCRAQELAGPSVELYQDSSGGPNWRSSNHVNGKGVVPNSFQGYRVECSDGRRSGLRATPVLSLNNGSEQLALAMPYFWQNFPKALECAGHSVVLRLFPSQWSDLHEIQGGEQKTHVFCVAFGPDPVTADPPLHWVRMPTFARATPSWYCSTGAIPYLTPAAEDPNVDHQRLVASAIDGTDTFEQKREAVDEYGWRHFGEIYADHETVFHRGASPLVSHYNNQYDAIAGFAYQFMRSGDRRWYAQLTELAGHVVDIDIYHTEQDSAAYNGGLFWHTCHHVDAAISTHRAYPHSDKVQGGGPSAEHNYATGLMLHHFLTGDRASLEAAVGLAYWVMAMDDGTRTKYRFLDTGHTGIVSVAGTFMDHGPARSSGNSLSALLVGHCLTGDAALLDKAEELIRRCIHPADDIAKRDLLDAERRWHYTVFLEALGRYLDHKESRGELDRMYAYGRASLLAYARWMALNETPFLKRSASLEYPTETWAAQDIRKSEIFTFAAKHAGGAERAVFLDKAEFFFRYSTSTLLGMPTRTFARPVVLMLGHGFMHAFFRQRSAISAPPPRDEHPFEPQEPFVPQRIRAKRRLTLLVVLTLTLGALGVLMAALVHLNGA